MTNAQTFQMSVLNLKRYFINTSFRTKWLFLRRKLIERANPWVPRQFWIGVTYRCQCECVHCFLGPMLNKQKNELSKDEIFPLIEKARQMGCLEVSYFGGEPLLCEDLVELVRYSSSKGLLTSIYTNGMLLTREKVRLLKQAGLSFCNVSLDSGLPEEHNSLRGVINGFEKAVEGIRYLVEEGIKCSIWTYVSKRDVKDDLRQLRSLIGIAKKLNIWKIVILFPIASGNWLCRQENILTREERDRVRSLHNPPFVSLEFPEESTNCSAGKSFVYITPQGEVSPCPAIPYYFGNIRREPLADILKKINGDFSKADEKKCGECVMNQDGFREHMLKTLDRK